MPRYEERLRVPWWWWLLAAVMVLTLWASYDVAVGAWALLVAAGAGLAVAAGLWRYGSALVRVDAGGVRAGSALLPHEAVGEVRVLDREAAARLRGPGYDPAAYYVIRGYLPRAVLVTVSDVADATPFWYVASRHPERLASAIEAARTFAAADREHDDPR